jgi:hypothetical protein
VRAWLLGKEKHIEHFVGNGSCVWSPLTPGSAIASKIQTAPIIFLNPLAYATPGATLFVHQTWNESQIAFAVPPASHDTARLRGCSSIWIGSAIQAEERLRARLFQLRSFRSVLTFLCELYESRARLDHVTASGWQLVTRQ